MRCMSILPRPKSLTRGNGKAQTLPPYKPVLHSCREQNLTPHDIFFVRGIYRRFADGAFKGVKEIKEVLKLKGGKPAVPSLGDADLNAVLAVRLCTFAHKTLAVKSALKYPVNDRVLYRLCCTEVVQKNVRRIEVVVSQLSLA